MCAIMHIHACKSSIEPLISLNFVKFSMFWSVFVLVHTLFTCTYLVVLYISHHKCSMSYLSKDTESEILCSFI